MIILMVFAFVFFALASGVPFAEPWPWRVRLIAAGLAAWSLAELIPHLGGLLR